MLASGAGTAGCVSLLLDRGSAVDASDSSGMTAFLYACASGKTECVNSLTVAGCSVSAKNSKGETGWSLSKNGGHQAVLRILERLLVIAVKANDSAKMEGLLQGGVNINARTDDGRTALIEMSQAGNVKLLHMLLELKADMDLQDQQGQTAFHLACLSGKSECVETLVRRGCKTSLRDKNGKTGAVLAKDNGKDAVLGVLGRVHMSLNVVVDKKFGGDYTRYIVSVIIDGTVVSATAHRYSEFDGLRNHLLSLPRWQK